MSTREKYPFENHDVPGPPESLRGRVLDAAGTALARDTPSDIWTRLWENRTARLAWAGCIAGLVVAHLFVTPRDVAPTRIVQVDDEIRLLTSMPRLDADAVASVARIGQENPL